MMNGVIVVVMVVVVVYPQPSTPLPCFINVTIKPGGQMGPQAQAAQRGGFVGRWPYWP